MRAIVGIAVRGFAPRWVDPQMLLVYVRQIRSHQRPFVASTFSSWLVSTCARD